MIGKRKGAEAPVVVVRIGSEKVVAAAAEGFIHPYTGIALASVPFAFYLDGSRVTGGAVGRTASVGPNGNVNGIIAALVGACLLEFIEQVTGKVNCCSDGRLVSHGCFSRGVMVRLA